MSVDRRCNDRHAVVMWLDGIDRGGGAGLGDCGDLRDGGDLSGRGICRAAVGPLGRALRGARMQQLMSQAELAKAAGVHQTQVSKLELGAANWALFCRLVDVLGGEPVVTVEPLPGDVKRLRQLAATIW